MNRTSSPLRPLSERVGMWTRHYLYNESQAYCYALLASAFDQGLHSEVLHDFYMATRPDPRMLGHDLVETESQAGGRPIRPEFEWAFQF